MKKKIIIISKILVAFWVLLLVTILAFMYLSKKEEIEVSDPLATIFMVILGLTGLIFCIMFILEIVASIKANEKHVFLKQLGEFILVIVVFMLYDMILLKSDNRIEAMGMVLSMTILNGGKKYWKRK